MGLVVLEEVGGKMILIGSRGRDGGWTGWERLMARTKGDDYRRSGFFYGGGRCFGPGLTKFFLGWRNLLVVLCFIVKKYVSVHRRIEEKREKVVKSMYKWNWYDESDVLYIIIDFWNVYPYRLKTAPCRRPQGRNIGENIIYVSKKNVLLQ